MDFFFGSSSSSDEKKDASFTIDKLCDRVRDADLLEDRRSAVQGLRGLSREFQLVLFHLSLFFIYLKSLFVASWN
jgi:hypothetical protein